MLFIKNIILCLGILLAASVANAMSNGVPVSLSEDEPSLILVHQYKDTQRVTIEKEGLKGSCHPLLHKDRIPFLFIPGMQRNTIPQDCVGLSVRQNEIWVQGAVRQEIFIVRDHIPVSELIFPSNGTLNLYEPAVLIVHDCGGVSREKIEKEGLCRLKNKVYFIFTPEITIDNIPHDHVGLMVNPGKTWVYNGSFRDGVLPQRFRDYYNMSCMLLSTYIERQDLAARIRRNNLSSELQVLPDETLIFNPINAFPIVVSKNDERVLKDLNYKFKVPSNLQKTDFEPHHYLYRPTISVYGSIPANMLIFPATKSSGRSRNISGTHPITCRPYSTYIRALRRFF